MIINLAHLYDRNSWASIIKDISAWSGNDHPNSNCCLFCCFNFRKIIAGQSYSKIPVYKGRYPIPVTDTCLGTLFFISTHTTNLWLISQLCWTDYVLSQKMQLIWYVYLNLQTLCYHHHWWHLNSFSYSLSRKAWVNSWYGFQEFPNFCYILWSSLQLILSRSDHFDHGEIQTWVCHGWMPVLM